MKICICDDDCFTIREIRNLLLPFQTEEDGFDISDFSCGEDLIDYYECNREYDFFLQLHKLGGVAASACTKLIKRSAIGTLRFKEGILHEDEEFVTRLLPECRTIGYCSNEFYKYLMRPGSIINSCFSRNRLDIVPIMKERIKYLDGKNYIDLSRVFRTQLYRNL